MSQTYTCIWIHMTKSKTQQYFRILNFYSEFPLLHNIKTKNKKNNLKKLNKHIYKAKL